METNSVYKGCANMSEKYDEHSALNYHETENELQPLVFIHAQGVDGTSFADVSKKLSKRFHVYSIDCYGHGGSRHAPEEYNIQHIGRAVIDFIENVVKSKVWLLGHSSGGLIAAYIASETDLCDKLILEDPPFFASQGERRKNTFNYVDLSTVCHRYNSQNEYSDFVLYYFSNQYAWNFFPEKSREQIKGKLVKLAATDRKKHPDKNLKIPFWPKAALEGFRGMSDYDPLFGETFYDDSFHCDISHEDMLKKIRCKTYFMKATTEVSPNGILLAALNEEDLAHVSECIANCEVIRFHCGHGIHIEKPKEFTNYLLNL